MKRIICMMLWMVGVLSVSAQTISIIDQTDLHGIENAIISSNNQSVFTDAKGNADISEFSKENELIIQHPNYKLLKISYAELESLDFKIKLAESIIAINEITISANRLEQFKNEVSNQVASINAKEIAFSNVQTTADLLGLNHSVFIQKSQLGGGSPMIRGFSTNRILLVIDGVRMNNAIYRSGNLQNVISLDALITEKAEIVFGPGAVIYGSDAIGGVMTFLTLSPSFSYDKPLFYGSFLTRYSTANNEKTDHLHFAFQTKKWGFLSSITYSSFDDLQMGSRNHEEYTRNEYVTRIGGTDSILTNPNKNIQKESGYRQINLMQKIRFMPNKNLDIQYSLHFSRLSDVPRYDRLIEYKNNKLVYAQWYYGPQKWLMNAININYKKSNSIFDQFKIIAAHQSYEESRNDRKIGKSVLRQKTENVSAVSVNLDLEKKLNETNSLSYGIEFIHNLVNSKGLNTDITNNSQTNDASRYPDGSTYMSNAAYITYKKDINEKLIINTGIRYNSLLLKAVFDTTYYKFPFTAVENRNGALNGSVGMVYKQSDTWIVKLNASTGFRTPNIDDIGKVFDSEPGHVVVPNPDLKPEYAYNLDFSISKTIKEKIQIDATGFYIYLDHAIVRRDFLFNGKDSIEYGGELSKVQALVNTSKAYVYGFQLALNAEIIPSIYLQGFLSYTKGEEQDEETAEYVPLRHAAPLFGSIHLMYRKGRFKADFYVDHNSAISTENLAPSEKAKPAIYTFDKNGNLYCPEWQTINFKFAYHLNKYMHFNIGVENMLDVRYRPYSSGIVAPGRNFIFSLKLNF